MAELLAVEGVTAGYGDGVVLEDVSLVARRRRQPRAARAQRHGQDDAARDADGLHARARRRAALARGGPRGTADAPAQPVRARLGAAGAVHVPVADRRGAPDRGGAARPLERRPRLRDLSAARGAARQLRQPALRRRAADARDRARADGQPGAAAARRADGRARADHRAGADERDPRARHRKRHGGDRRRAAREARAVAHASGDRARTRARRPSFRRAKRCCTTPIRCTGWSPCPDPLQRSPAK